MKYGMSKSAKRLRLWSSAMAAAVLFALIACGSRSDKPKILLTKSQMVHAMTDLYLTEQRVISLGVPRDSSLRIFGVLSPKALEEAGTSDSVFRQSLNYYMANPKDLEEIFNALIDSLNLREQKMISNEVKK